jgi:hypothetical protein
METITITQNRLIELPKFKVYRKPKPFVKRAKIKPAYPKIIMPEQPVGYIKPRANDCW